jgi:hypothetical protein
MLSIEQILKHRPPPSPTIDVRRLVWLGKNIIQRVEAHGEVVWTFNDRVVVSPTNIDELSRLLDGYPIFKETA